MTRNECVHKKHLKWLQRFPTFNSIGNESENYKWYWFSLVIMMMTMFWYFLLCFRTILQLKCLIRSKEKCIRHQFLLLLHSKHDASSSMAFISSFLPPPRYFLVLSIRVSFLFLHLILIPASTLPSYFLSKNFLSSGLVLKDFSRENLLQTHHRKGTFESRAWCWGSE